VQSVAKIFVLIPAIRGKKNVIRGKKCVTFVAQKNNLNSKALIGICIALLLPVGSYFIMKHYGDNAVSMPRRYYADTVINKVVNGKEVTDTVWHKVANITLTNQLGNKVSLDDLQGKIIVADFFFTRCPNICPALTRNMKKLQNALKLKDDTKMVDTSFVQFLSFSIDPVRDSVAALKKYADRFGVNHDVWWMLTGDKKQIYDFTINEIKLGLEDGEGVDSNFIHSQKMVVIDKDRIIRSYYNGLDSLEMQRLAEDITLLMLEKDRKKKSTIFTQIKGLWPVFVIAILGVAIFFFINRKPSY
jgi:protein SCO1/2